MLFCRLCKIWVQPTQWVDSAFNGQVFLVEVCPCCHQGLAQLEPATV